MKHIDCKAFIEKLPKAELHVHIEGTMKPVQLRIFAQRNNVTLPAGTVSADGQAYVFHDYNSFINNYLQATLVLRHEQDFYDVTWAYLERVAKQGVLHTEIFFDLQTYMPRGIGPDIIVNGIHRALVDAQKILGVSGNLILCIIRHLSEEDGVKALELARPYRDKIVGIGLASIEDGNPPEKFARVFAQARAQGYHLVAHVAESLGGADMIRQALSVLHVERIDHGIGCMSDPELVRELALKKIPLTICPQSNVVLGIYKNIAEHPLKKLFDAGVIITINSDDPAFFGGYIADNYQAAASALGFSCAELVTCARYSFQASFLDDEAKKKCLAQLDAYAAQHSCV